MGQTDRQLGSGDVEWPVDISYNSVTLCVCVCVCVHVRARSRSSSGTLSSSRFLFSSLAVAKYDQDQFLVRKFAINSKTVRGCNSACDRWDINLINLIETR